MGYRVIAGGVLSDGCNNSTFRQGQIRYILIEVSGRCRLDSQASLSQVDCVHIGFQDLILAQLLFQLQSQILFLELTAETQELVAFCTAGKDGQL